MTRHFATFSHSRKSLVSLVLVSAIALTFAAACYAATDTFQTGTLPALTTSRASDNRGDWKNLHFWYKAGNWQMRVAWVDANNGNWVKSDLKVGTHAVDSNSYYGDFSAPAPPAGHTLKAICRNPTGTGHYVNCEATN